MKYVLWFVIIAFCYSFVVRKYKNPYKLYMVFGKKGSGKSAYLVRQAIKYQKKGYIVYTNMSDCCLEGVRIINPDKLGDFVPVRDSCLLLDEVGMLYDNRNFKNFKTSVRDFFKLQRHYKVTCYLASQTFDIDKKLRDLTDEMFLISNIATAFSLVRPIRKTVTLTEATAEGESRIAENLKFRIFTSWRLYWIPSMIKYFESFKAPELPDIGYIEPVNPVKLRARKLRRARKNKTLKKNVVSTNNEHKATSADVTRD